MANTSTRVPPAAGGLLRQGDLSDLSISRTTLRVPAARRAVGRRPHQLPDRPQLPRRNNELFTSTTRRRDVLPLHLWPAFCGPPESNCSKRLVGRHPARQRRRCQIGNVCIVDKPRRRDLGLDANQLPFLMREVSRRIASKRHITTPTWQTASATSPSVPCPWSPVPSPPRRIHQPTIRDSRQGMPSAVRSRERAGIPTALWNASGPSSQTPTPIPAEQEPETFHTQERRTRPRTPCCTASGHYARSPLLQPVMPDSTAKLLTLLGLYPKATTPVRSPQHRTLLCNCPPAPVFPRAPRHNAAWHQRTATAGSARSPLGLPLPQVGEAGAFSYTYI